MLTKLIALCLLLMTLLITSCNNGITTGSALPKTNGDIYFGDIDGIVYKNSQTLNGLSPQVFGRTGQIMATDNTNNIYLATGDGFVYKYAKGIWSILGNNAAGGTYGVITGMTIVNNAVYVVFNISTVESFPINGNGTWQQVGSTVTNAFSLTASESNLYVGTFDGNIESYPLNGSSDWETLNQTPLESYSLLSLVTDGQHLYTNNHESVVSISVNGGTWNQLGQDLSFGNIASLAVDGNIIYVATSAGYVESISANATTWLTLGGESIEPEQSINSIAATNGLVVAGLGDGSVWANYNNSNWTKQGIINLESSVTNIAIFNNTIYAATNNGYVYQSTNSGPWLQLGLSSVDGTSITMLQIDKYGNIYAGTIGGYVYECTLGLSRCEWIKKYGNGYPIFLKYASSIE